MIYPGTVTEIRSVIRASINAARHDRAKRDEARRTGDEWSEQYWTDSAEGWVENARIFNRHLIRKLKSEKQS